MLKLASVLFYLAGFALLQGQASLLTRMEKKEASRVYSEPVEFEQVNLSACNLDPDSFLKKDDQVIQIRQEGKVAGYILRSSAKGRYENFDYSVFYSPDLAVLGVKVTVYRSTHGAAICQKKWLSQFHGYKGGELILGRDIDAITGASISAQSMLEDIQRCFMLMTRLQEDGWMQ